MNTIPPDLPNDAPLPSGKPRCPFHFEGERCTRARGHQYRHQNNPRHHISADGTRWTIDPRSKQTQRVGKCSATYQGQYRCDRWPHNGYHGVMVTAEESSPETKSERIEWTGNGADAQRRATEHDDQHQEAA